VCLTGNPRTILANIDRTAKAARRHRHRPVIIAIINIRHYNGNDTLPSSISNIPKIEQDD
jgi:hypothetical protein